VRRDTNSLASKNFDLVIVGGGIFGICAAWDAILRGLSVALLEKGDFAHAASGNCFKIVHSGIRYLQHGDISRIRESIKELNALLRIAPHLVYPIPILIPTYGHGRKGKFLLRLGQLLFNLIAYDRNQFLRDPERMIPRGHTISPRECLSLFPGLSKKGLTGAVIFYDGQMYSPVRLALSYLRSAVQAGVIATNYFEVLDFLREGNRVIGVSGKDMLTGDSIDVRGKVVLNATGPWAEGLLRQGLGTTLRSKISYSRDSFFVVPRCLNGNYALALQGRTRDRDAVFSRGTRHLFIVPWRGYTIIGVWHHQHRGPDDLNVSENELQSYLLEIKELYPPLSLSIGDISMINAGLVLSGGSVSGEYDFRFGKRSVIIDHAKENHLDGLITLIGVRYTTSRGVAEKVIDLVMKKLRKRNSKSDTFSTSIFGGDIGPFYDFLIGVSEELCKNFSKEVIRGLVHNHGSEYRNVLKYVDEDESLCETIGESNVIKAEVIHAVREEMAQKLADVVLRRTDLGSADNPRESEIRVCAELMAKELGWDDTRLRNEINEVKSTFPRFTLNTFNEV
jgi:glycerol-3-phosphate dehydrogenase